jgi:hypothetical protein
MVGAFITFLVVCAIVTVYMTIVHSFLREAEEPEDSAREQRLREPRGTGKPPEEPSSQPHWAH